MPTYEFTCPTGHDFDKFYRSMASAPTVVPCPVCGEPADRQMSAGAGLVFHGTGFYITDYGKDGKKDQKSAASTSSDSKKNSSVDAKFGESNRSDSNRSDSNRSDSKPAESKSESRPAESTGSEAKSGGETSPKPLEAPVKAATPSKASE